MEETIYNCLSPEVKASNVIEAKQNEAFVERNQAYMSTLCHGTNIDGIIMEGNKVYATCANVDMIATEGNQAVEQQSSIRLIGQMTNRWGKIIIARFTRVRNRTKHPPRAYCTRRPLLITSEFRV